MSTPYVVTSSQSVYPQGGTRTFGQMKEDVAATLGVDKDPDEVSRAGRLIHNIIDELNMQQTWTFNLIESPPINTVAGTPTYSIPTDFWKTYNARKTSDIDYTINTVRQASFDQMFISQVNITGYPYVMVIRNTFREGYVTLFPTPDTVYTFKLRYYKFITKPTTDGDYLDLPEPYQVVLEYGATARMAARHHMMDVAQHYHALYEQKRKEMQISDDDLGDEMPRFINIEEIYSRSTNFVNPAARPRPWDFF